ncbi:MAG TPA: hypothetical protein VI452_17045 [Marmoricola sp.]|jgi:hypothetical protein
MADEPQLVPIGELQLIAPASAAFPCDVCGAPSRFLLQLDDQHAFLCAADFEEQIGTAEEVLRHSKALAAQLDAPPRVPPQRGPR